MNKLSERSDQELLHSFMQGHVQAFDVLFLRYKADITRMVLHYTRDSSVADDLVQESFIKVFSSLTAGRYNEEGKFRPWILRVAHNLCMDHLKKPSRIVYVEQFSPSVLAYHTTASPEEALIRRQRSAQLAQLEHQLPEDLKQVVTYRHYEEMSVKEIAEKTAACVSTSLGRMRYGVMHLRKAVQSDPVFRYC